MAFKLLVKNTTLFGSLRKETGLYYLVISSLICQLADTYQVLQSEGLFWVSFHVFSLLAVYDIV